MKSSTAHKLILVLALTGMFTTSRAQATVQTYIDIGENNVSEGTFIKNACQVDYVFNRFILAAATQFDINGNAAHVFSGLHLSASRFLQIKTFPIEIKGYYILNRFSELMHETDWGAKLNTRKLPHFLFETGINFRTYAINSNARNDYQVDKTNSKLHENYNLIYRISAYLKPYPNQWNLALSVTNTDHFLVNQPTNPIFNLQGLYRIQPRLLLYFESWYESAGVFNISTNYFGYYFRTGIQWKLDKS